MLLPPPIGQFPSREALMVHVEGFASRQGYAVTIKRTARDTMLWLKCDLGGTYDTRFNLTAETRKRATSSKLIDCPFELYGSQKEDGLWHLSVTNGNHNHDPSPEMSGHPFVRRLNRGEKRNKVAEQGDVVTAHNLGMIAEHVKIIQEQVNKEAFVCLSRHWFMLRGMW